MLNSRIIFLVFLVVSISLTSCVSQGGGGAKNEPSNSAASTNSSPTDLSLSSRCGTVNNGQIFNPVTTAEPVDVSAISSDTVIITRLSGDQAGGQQLVKLHGVTANGVSAALVRQGVDAINAMGQAYFVPVSDNCAVTVIGGGQGVYGQLFSGSAVNVSEVLIEGGAVVPTNDACGGELLVGCYQSIEVNEQVSTTVIDDFLWKPVSDSNGNLVVLVNPFGATVVVNGRIKETLVDSGPGNGRGTQARAKYPGCSYGNNVKVEFFDLNGLRILTAAGDRSIVVANGCQRVEKRF